MKIGFIGIGLMGGPLARNLIRAGKEVYIYGRNQQHINKVLSAGTKRFSYLRYYFYMFATSTNSKINHDRK